VTAGRVVGVDIARCVALLGMMATHILPGEAVRVVAAGRASALFAVLAGVSLVLVAGRRTPLRGRTWAAVAAGTVVRAALIGLLGLWLGGFETGIAVILVYYAVLFVVAVPFLAMPSAALLAVTVAWTALAPWASQVLRSDRPEASYDVPAFASLAAPGDLLRELLLTGYYPVLTWVPYVLVGILVGRLDLCRGRSSALLAAVGAACVAVSVAVSDALVARPGVEEELLATFSVAGWRGDLETSLAMGLYGVVPTGSPWWLAVRAPHSGTSFDLLMTIGSACVVLAACLLLGRAAPRVTAVLFGAGAMTLTLYSLHVLLRTDGWWDGADLRTYLGQVALVLAIGATFALLGRRGPLETAVAVPSTAARRLVGGRR
jgi:hypothetical protein